MRKMKRIGESLYCMAIKRGLVAYKELLKLLSASGIIKNENKVYHYYPHILNIQEWHEYRYFPYIYNNLYLPKIIRNDNWRNKTDKHRGVPLS